MSLELITDELFQEHIKKANRQFYEQSPQMATHLRKRGYRVQILAYVVEDFCDCVQSANCRWLSNGATQWSHCNRQRLLARFF